MAGLWMRLPPGHGRPASGRLRYPEPDRGLRCQGDPDRTARRRGRAPHRGGAAARSQRAGTSRNPCRGPPGGSTGLARGARVRRAGHVNHRSLRPSCRRDVGRGFRRLSGDSQISPARRAPQRRPIRGAAQPRGPGAGGHHIHGSLRLSDDRRPSSVLLSVAAGPNEHTGPFRQHYLSR